MNIATKDKKSICLNVAMLASELYGYEEGVKLALRWEIPIPYGKK